MAEWQESDRAEKIQFKDWVDKAAAVELVGWRAHLYKNTREIKHHKIFYYIDGVESFLNDDKFEQDWINASKKNYSLIQIHDIFWQSHYPPNISKSVNREHLRKICQHLGEIEAILKQDHSIQTHINIALEKEILTSLDNNYKNLTMSYTPRVNSTSLETFINRFSRSIITKENLKDGLLLPMPYGFYDSLRLIVCICLYFFSQVIFPKRQDHRRWFATIIALFILYNPIIPIHFGAQPVWTILNIITLWILFKARIVFDKNNG